MQDSADKHNHANLAISIHPVVLLTMSDCWTRLKFQHDAHDSSQALRHAFVSGVVLGKQDGRHVQLLNCFPMPEGESKTWSSDSYQQSVERFRETSPELIVMGAFFCTASGDFNVKQCIGVTNEQLPLESAFVLLLEPQMRHLEQLPLKLLCPVLSSECGDNALQYVSLPFTMVTHESERIAVDQLSQSSACISMEERAKRSQISASLASESEAIEMMLTRMHALCRYVRSVRLGELVCDRSLIREITAICQRMRRERLHEQQASHNPSTIISEGATADCNVTSAIDEESDLARYQRGLHQQSCEVTLTGMLGHMITGVDIMNDIVHKSAIVHSEQRREGSSDHYLSGSKESYSKKRPPSLFVALNN